MISRRGAQVLVAQRGRADHLAALLGRHVVDDARAEDRPHQLVRGRLRIEDLVGLAEEQLLRLGAREEARRRGRACGTCRARRTRGARAGTARSGRGAAPSGGRSGRRRRRVGGSRGSWGLRVAGAPPADPGTLRHFHCARNGNRRPPRLLAARPQLTGGRSCWGNARWNASATRSTRSSRPCQLAIWRPTGRPSTKPHGTETAGKPSQLKITVWLQ